MMTTTLFYHTYFFDVGSCRRFLQISSEPPPRRGGWATPGALGVDTRSRYAAVDVSLRTALFGVGLEKSPSDANSCAVLATASFAPSGSKI